jgi:D-citramalate synthase
MKVKVLDSTLRDGEQAPGVAFTPEQKLEIAKALDELGVDIIEAGSPATSEGERKGIKMIATEGLKAEVCCFARCLKEDIDWALQCEVDSVHLVVPTSDLHLQYKLKKSRGEVEQMALDALHYALDHGLVVEFSAEDASRSDREFLFPVLSRGAREGAQRLCLCDTVGVLTPEKSFELFSEAVKVLGAPVSAHCHNDFGMATANTLAAVRAGATEVHVTVNGLGERAGNASLEEVAVALKQLYGVEVGLKLEKLYEVSKLVERYSKVPVQPHKAIVGENAFAHEAGIHVHGVLEKPATYEPFPPELVGRERRILFGKHTGSHALERELLSWGLSPTKEQVAQILSEVKRLGDMGKSVTDSELRALAASVLGRKVEEVIKLEELTVVSGNRITPTASARLRFRDREVVESGLGVGPVDAAMNAIKKVVEEMANIKLLEYHVDAISGGTDAVVDVVVKLTDGKRIVTARGISGDIIMASVQALLSGVNTLLG